MAAAKGGGLLALLAAPKGGAPGKPGASAPGGDAKTMAAEDLIDAIGAGDANGVATAFQRMYDHCAMGGGEEAEETDEYAIEE